MITKLPTRAKNALVVLWETKYGGPFAAYNHETDWRDLLAFFDSLSDDDLKYLPNFGSISLYQARIWAAEARAERDGCNPGPEAVGREAARLNDIVMAALQDTRVTLQKALERIDKAVGEFHGRQ